MEVNIDYDEFEEMYADELEDMYNDQIETLKGSEENSCPNSGIPPTPMNPKVKRNLEFGEEKKNSRKKKSSNALNESGLEPLVASSQESTTILKSPAHINIDEDFYLSEDEAPGMVKELHEHKETNDFGAQLDFTELPYFPPAKRARIDPDLDMIEKIVHYRNSVNNAVSLVNSRKTVAQTNSGMGSIHRHLPQGGFVSLTTVSGERFYLDFLDDNLNEDPIENTITNVKGHLLSEPYANVKAAAEGELDLLKARKTSVQQNPPMEIVEPEENSTNNDVLWVEKYKPANYLDLLSDESTNRVVLRWLKLWDKLVFGKEPKVKTMAANTAKDKKKKFFNKAAPEIIEEFDEHGRPEQKVIMLCGPPGLGKTTLAHILAKHAGYNIVEMNASDDRSVEAFRNTLENALTMTPVFGTINKPNCLIIDEIDGAPAPSINFLVNILIGKKSKEVKKGKKKDSMVLKRPIICICNDLYAVSLRPLRKISLNIHFPPTMPSKLAARLHAISLRQNLKADLSALRALCDKTENDIRSCLSVLQFVKNSTGELKFADFDSIAIGQKDYQRSLFNVWNDIFSIPRSKKRRVINPHTLKRNADGTAVRQESEAEDATSLASRFKSLLRTTQSCGEYDKLSSGWFENYLKCKFKHVHLEPVVAGLDWTTTTDIFQKEINRHQTWALMGYIPYSFVAYHFLFATLQKHKIQFPTQHGDYTTRLTKCRSLLTSLISEMPPQTRLFSPESSLVFDILPLLLVILQPQLRPVNYHLFNQQEKQVLNGLVNTMISYNLSYTQERSPEGQYSFNLDPNVEEVVFFPDLTRLKPMPYSSRQLVAREIEIEKLRRTEAYFGTQRKPVQAPAVPGPTKPKEPTKGVVPNHLQKLKAKAPALVAEAKRQAPKDFFGRTIAIPVVDDQNKSAGVGDVWFKFKEGYSNAVRRPAMRKMFVGH